MTTSSTKSGETNGRTMNGTLRKGPRYFDANEDGTGGEHIDTQEADTNQDELQKQYLEDLRGGVRPLPLTLLQSLADYIISCGSVGTNIGSKTDFNRYAEYSTNSQRLPLSCCHDSSFKIKGTSAHLTRHRGHRMEPCYGLWDEFDIDHVTQPISSRCWEAQVYKTSRLKPERGHLDYKAIEPFMRFCIRITGEPIRNDRSQHYEYYEGSPYIYLVNSGDSGMRLYYDDNTPEQIKTKKAAIIVGGQILSRGLTIEGLTTSFFGRTARCQWATPFCRWDAGSDTKSPTWTWFPSTCRKGCEPSSGRLPRRTATFASKSRTPFSKTSDPMKFSLNCATAPTSDRQARPRVDSSVQVSQAAIPDAEPCYANPSLARRPS